MTNTEPIALIGSACRFPGESDTPSKLWELLKQPRDLLRKVPQDRFNADAFYHQDGKHHGTSNVRHSYFLEEDPAAFDNGFFNIPAGEAEAIDPQQRMLMETVYDSLCAAGQTVEGLRGSPTSVFVGVMCGDWDGMVSRDMESYPQYGATGTARSIMSNRISYYFDWHGPCMTIDTACSSSLVAVHQAIQTLQSGESNVAIAAGANLILSPAMYVAESKLSMLSPEGRSRMWDKDVDGYARGEGIAAVVLKPLSAAIRDNDHIECIIRGTGVNQDGRTPGLTMPSGRAQAALIRNTYLRAGLDISKIEDRPQFFHAHGTGTAAGDPQEAQAISEAFYPHDNFDDKLYVGSIKTVIGHTEGTAGLASLIGTSLALQNKLIPPNMHFQTLNPRLEPYYHHLEVPTKCIPWPDTHTGQPRRASINSFGFGGTNAHAILEAYEAPNSEPEQEQTKCSSALLFSPFIFSAASESSLRALLSSYLAYLQLNQPVDLSDLAYSLQSRTSTLPYRVAITASTRESLCEQISDIVDSKVDSTIGTRQLAKSSPKVLGVFTGQGSQWAKMGAQLIHKSPFVTQRLSELDRALAEAPASQRPQWTLQELILADPEVSRMNEAAVSQPVCTAVQIVLVDLLRFAGVNLHTVVGHSSGEIGAAYAAGLLSGRDAIRAAYYRGLYAHLAKSPNGSKGSMMAVGTTFEDATEFCELEDFEGRIQVAAQNSPSSITLSGDEDAIMEAIEIFKDEGKFARQLKVDTAYHSMHVKPCCEPYREALVQFQPDSPIPTGTKWYSSVYKGRVMGLDHLGAQYWIDNMANPVLFAPAVTTAWDESGPFDIVIEVGPHPVLKTPCLDTIEDICGERPPYSGVLRRGGNDVDAYSDALGFIWTHLGPGSVDFVSYERAISQSSTARQFLTNLPKYPFDHSRQFMSLSRVSGIYRDTQGTPHPLLGRRCHDRETSELAQWRNILSPREIPWMAGHQIENQITLPATGYLCMAIEAIGDYVGRSNMGLIAVRDLRIHRALVFSDDSPEVETLVDLHIVSRTKEAITAQFSCFSGAPHESKPMIASANGTVEVTFATPEAGILSSQEIDDLNLNELDPERFYKFLSGLGYNYAPPFRGTTNIRRKADYAVGTIRDQSGMQWEDQLIVHPGMLDTALQTGFAAFCCPGDERLWGLHLPTGIRSVLVNPYFSPIGIGKQTELRYLTVSKQDKSAKISADVHLFAGESNQAFLQMEGTDLVPLAPAVPSNDAVLFSRFDYKLASPDGDAAALPDAYSRADFELGIDEERISFYYLRRLLELVTKEDVDRSLPHYRHLLNYAARMVPPVIKGENPYIPASAQYDTEDFINKLIAKHYDNNSVRLLQSVGSNLPETVRSGASILEHMVKDSMLDRIYEDGFGLNPINDSIARMVGQIAHRYPRMNIFEIGAGTGGSTKRILQTLGSAFSTYTYTDVSSSFFGQAQDLFKDFEDRMVFKTFDMDQTPESQDFVEGSYDIVIGSNVLHATVDMEKMMQNVRRLLKPGGYLIILEIVDNSTLRVGLTFGSLPGWWLGAETGRELGPTLTLPQWDNLLGSCGFGGIETSTPTIHPLIPLHVFCAQAVDERVQMLREPLSHPMQLPVPTAPCLVVVGGTKFGTHRVCGQLISLLRPMFAQVQRVLSIEELSPGNLVEGSTLLSLAELDQPIFATSTFQKFEALKTIWRRAKNILWVSTGARAENPHSQMMNGIARCMRSEYPNITLQILDVDHITKDTGNLIAEHLLRLEMLGKWSTGLPAEELMWSLEPEVYIENATKLIPRLYPCEASNKRYNTARRVVTDEVDPQHTSLTFTMEEGIREVQRHSPLHMHPALPFSCETRTIRVTHFFLSTLSIVSGAHLRLCVGVDIRTQETLFAVSPTLQSPAMVPADWCITLDRQTDPVAMLSAISSYLVAHSISQLASTGDMLVVHEPHPYVVDILQNLLGSRSIGLQITTSEKNPGKEWLFVNKNFPERVVRDILPSTTTKFLDLSAKSEAARVIVRCLPRSCQIIDPATVLYARTELRASVSREEVTDVLKQAYDHIGSYAEAAKDIPVIQLKDVTNHSGPPTGHFSLVDCTGPSVQAVVRPIDEGTLFHAKRTYLLVGLSGELGQSLCKWMVAHGAKHVVLTSRRPKINPKFNRLMEHMGAMVKILPMDVTNRESARECYETIVKTMPPLAGVANGAMVLRDNLFDKMPYEDFMAVTNPKVLGSLILDELFHDTPLDFFVYFSSTTAVLGNSGQSNYAAANQFMSALAAQRKKRGLAASSIDISSIIGIGYVERDNVVDEFTFTKMGYRPMSEQDLHYAFAEAILIGNPAHPGPGELVTGVSPLHLGDQASDQFFRDPKFGHYILERPEEQASMGNASHNQPVRAQLAAAKTKVAVFSIIKDAFLTRLRRILAVSSDADINDKVTFVEQGIDSLMAVEVRSWFFKELGVDFPVLRILGGSSIADLLEESVRLLPSSIVDISKLEAGQKEKGEPASKPAAAAAKVEEKAPRPNVDISSSSSSSSDRSSDTGHTPPRTPTSGTVTPAFAEDGSAGSSSSLKAKNVAEEPDAQAVKPLLQDEVVCPMSFGQSSFYFLDNYLTDKTAFNMAVMFKLTGTLRVEDLEEAVRMTAKRHEILRTRFFWAGDGSKKEPMQAIASESMLKLSHKGIASEDEANQVLEMVRNQTWDLSSMDTSRVLLLTLSDEVHFIIISMHHIMADGYSFSVLLRDLDVAYRTKHLPPLPVESQYRSFASQQRRLHELGGTSESIRYFKETLSPTSAYLQPIQLLPFAKSTTRQPLTRYSQEEAKIQIGQDLNDKIRNLARKHKSTSFHVYLGALQVLLFNLLPSSSREIFIGIADANRKNDGFLQSVGFFLNLLPLRFERGSADTKLASIIQNARDTAYGALSHSEVPFDVLLRELNIPRSNDHTPLFQVFLDYKQVAQGLSSLGECKLSDAAWRNTSTGYDLILDVNEHMNMPAIIHLRLQSTLYSKESTDMLLRSYISVLEYMANAEDGMVGDVPAWSTSDIQAALAIGAGIPLNTQWPATVSERLDELIAKQPARPALKDGNGVALTYKEMGARIDCITNMLLSSGIQQGTVVGVFQEPSADWICSMLAILRAGCVYLPLDLRNSIPRLASIVKAAQPLIMLTDHTTTDKVALIGAGYATEVLLSSTDTSKWAGVSRNCAERDAPAVMLFTSGTTGEPKGIIMKNQNLIANAEANSHIYGATPDLVVLQQSAFSFDFSLDQTLAALTNGGCLYVVPARYRGDPMEISKIMLDEKVTYTSSTPSEYDMWLRYAADTLSRCDSWRHAFSGGEAMSRGVALGFRNLGLSQLRAFTGYGPAETTCFSTKFELNYQSLPEPLPAGFMLPGYTCVIVDEDLRPVPAGVAGEIVIGGPCVVSGYLGNPESTMQKFIPDTFFGTSTTMYRSGDRGRLMSDGTLYCDGRLEGDSQVKLRGFRVELVEVEKAIVKHASGAISQAVVTLRGSGEEGFLAAHVVFVPDFPRESRERTIQAIRYSLPLPPYMRPSAIVPLDDIPRTAHLKVDRRALQALPVEQGTTEKAADGKNASDQLTESELKLSELWRQVMPLDPGPLTPESDFFLVGGNSILLVKLQQLLKTSVAAAPQLVTLMGAPTLRAMTAVIRASRSGGAIDWEVETRLPHWAMQPLETSIAGLTRDSDSITVLLTGSGGYLGRHLLPSLVNDRKVSRVYCLARQLPGDGDNENADPKLSLIQSDVSQPNLGLSDEAYATLVAEVDAIVHCAANRSLWDQYEVLRPDNYDSVKELAKLATATRRPVPFHVLSSGAVASFDESGALPPQDGSDGYLSSKWAAEKFLHRFAAATGIPVFIHRPEPTPRASDRASTSNTTADAAVVLDQLVTIAASLRLRPAFDGVTGAIHLRHVDQVVQAIHQSLFHTSAGAGSTDLDIGHSGAASNPRILHHEAIVRIAVEDLQECFDRDDTVRLLPGFPVLDWFGKAKRAGLDYMITSWELVMGAGREVVSRR
ncbi:lovastatin nonaketide synthase [Aspergillus homomorphus CBS 101889]|uniref:Lovastatin nonaketide synthase n=1 Tax=Aspergillus homomorphus (strain CBS 101889) TaxID=1450537 RepID=A0A395HVN9_ASPHC|nr:lovastatin nonaketide synthase [Aspergillus homomorphus CBS 101889]RAL11483.1 lovastatin nonaketide synthase [Aspergillus homomorphus CBS 101889]